MKYTNADIDRKLPPGWQRVGQYKASREALSFRCPEGHEVVMFWGNLLHTKSCPRCSDRRLSNALVDKRLPAGWTRMGDYINSYTPMRFRCPNGHEVHKAWGLIQSGKGCSACIRHHNEDIDKWLPEGWQRNSDYKNALTPMSLTCDRGHSVKMSWNKIQEGKRCLYCFREKQRGENHPHWNPTRTAGERVKKRQYPGYWEWRAAVFKRDRHTCRRCLDGRGGNLRAHHLSGYAEHPELRLEVSNGITLCDLCHDLFHSIYGKRGNTPEQVRQWLNLSAAEWEALLCG